MLKLKKCMVYSVIPAMQSLVAESTDDHNRGVAFGWLQVTGNIGTILGGLLSVLLASTSFMGIAGWRISFHLVEIISVIVGVLVGLFAKDPRFVDKSSTDGSSLAKSVLLTENIGTILGGLLSVLLASTSFMGIAGWRISFHLVAIISVIVGVLVGFFAKDPRFVDKSSTDGSSLAKSVLLEFKELFREAKSVMKISSFQIIVAQGVSGSFPWSALSFAPMWLELIGFTHKQTALLMGMFTVASSIGALFGGKMGDVLSVRFPNAGRIILSQISSGSAIPLAWILLLGFPDDPNTAFKHGLILFIMGLFITWNAAATNNPIFAEIVPEKSRMSIYALDRSFESVLASFAPPVVGLLSQHAFGYKPIPQGSSLSVEVERDRENAASLAKALYTAIAIPMALCCFIYTFLYRTYPKDRDRAKMNALIESEMEQLKSENLPTAGDYSQVQVYEKETVIDLDYGAEEDGLAADESDEKTLLTRE
ncbi:uncharacterized protein LOC113300649 isoform X1 [Papaver somniferum]|uniref:uncharacterized protein LOC113300649 isoform X1 n=1 Tax=Papaver somniferum TaxID=3469 RepID=UPI000E701A4C|nr:uncharacterized protein LOC113300649 isoform X1 [Papaver somniferum]XP_026405640.1 uncharacterized protein LOC113300649 isoform X1 [Papaver somniferum]